MISVVVAREHGHCYPRGGRAWPCVENGAALDKKHAPLTGRREQVWVQTDRAKRFASVVTDSDCLPFALLHVSHDRENGAVSKLHALKLVNLGRRVFSQRVGPVVRTTVVV